jgi:hypothetical protein
MIFRCFCSVLRCIAQQSRRAGTGCTASSSAKCTSASKPACLGRLSELLKRQQEVLAPPRKLGTPPDAHAVLKPRWTQMTPEQREWCNTQQQRFQKWNAPTPGAAWATQGSANNASVLFLLPRSRKRCLRQDLSAFFALPPEQRKNWCARWNVHVTAGASGQHLPKHTRKYHSYAVGKTEDALEQTCASQTRSPGARMHPKAARVDKRQSGVMPK